MKFAQLVAYNIETFFLENQTQNAMEKLFPDLFSKIKIKHISGLKFHKVCFYCIPS